MVLKCVLLVIMMLGGGGWFDRWVNGWIIFDRPLGEVCQKYTHPYTHLMVATLTSPTVASHLTPPCKQSQGREVVVVMVEMVLMLIWCWVVIVVRDVFDGRGCDALANGCNHI